MHELPAAAFASDDALRALVLAYPEVLGGAEIGAGATGEPFDHLLVDQVGLPAIIGVMRSAADAAARHAVVGQVIEHAATLRSRWSVDALRTAFAEAPSRHDGSPLPEPSWETVMGNIGAGRVRLLFVTGEPSPELRAVAAMLNGGGGPRQAFVVELRQFAGGGMRAFVPTVVAAPGGEEQTAPARGPRQRQWDEVSFLAAARRRLGEEGEAALWKILDWAHLNGIPVHWGSRVAYGSFSLVHASPGRAVAPLWFSSHGRFEVRFPHLSLIPPFTHAPHRAEVVRQLNAIPGIELPSNAAGRYASLPLRLLYNPAAHGHFLTVAGWIFDQLRNPRVKPNKG